MVYPIPNGVYPDPKLQPEDAYKYPKYKSPVGLDWEDHHVQDDYTFQITAEDAAMLAEEVTMPTSENQILSLIGSYVATGIPWDIWDPKTGHLVTDYVPTITW